MTITRRRLEFLQAIKQIHETTGLPVHYIQVANRLGVSKWSAYDMMKVLENEGFLTRHYEVNSGEKKPGRAMVMFIPTPILDLALSGKSINYGITNWEWLQTKEHLLSIFDDPNLNNISTLWDQFLSELRYMENPLTFCAYIITIVVSELQTLSGNGLRFIVNMAKDVLKGQIGLPMFVGAAFGSIGKMAAQVSAVSKLAEYLVGFQKNLSKLTEIEQAMLLDFLEIILQKVAFAV